MVFQVLTISCTRKLLKRLRAEVRGDPTHPTDRLGDWFANLVSTKGETLVICVSERSLLPIFVTATKAPGSFIFAFQETVRSVLREIGASSELVEHEGWETNQIAIGTTASPRVLGSLNDLACLPRRGSILERSRSSSRRHLARPSTTKPRDRCPWRCCDEGTHSPIGGEEETPAQIKRRAVRSDGGGRRLAERRLSCRCSAAGWGEGPDNLWQATDGSESRGSNRDTRAGRGAGGIR